MSEIDRYGLRLGFAIAFFAVGIGYWAIPYGGVALPNALFGPGLVAVGIIALVLRARRIASFVRTTLVIGAAVPAVVVVRIAFEVARDPTSHNLWPLEVVIAGVVGGFVVLVGAGVGSMVRARGRTREGGGGG